MLHGSDETVDIYDLIISSLTAFQLFFQGKSKTELFQSPATEIDI